MSKGKTTPEGQFEQEIIDKLTLEQIGSLFASYIRESNHAGWDGFSKRDMYSVRKFLKDVKIYHDASKDVKHNDIP